MKKYFLIIAIIFLLFLGSIFMYIKVRDRVSSNDFFKKVATIYYEDEFNGKVVKKYIDWEQHGFMKIVLENQYTTREVRFDHESLRQFEYIKVGDTIIKKKETIDYRLKRNDFDTLIRLNFENINNRENYTEFLYELDSIYDW